MFRILVAEDDDNARFLMCEVLRRAGYEPCPARDGVEALEVMEHYQCDLAVEGISQTQEDGQTGTKVVYIPTWMQDYSVVYYDAHLNRTVESGGDLTEEEINSREDIFPEEMYTIAAEPNTKVEYDLHGFIQNIYYRGGDGEYYLDPATAAAMQP